MRVNDFGDYVASWHDLFTLTGTAAVTLLGLLFVAISLRMDIRKQSENSYRKRMTSQNLTSFLTVFMISCYFLIPDADPQGIAIAIVATTAIPLLNVVRSIGAYHREPAVSREMFIWYGVVQPACYVAAILGALALGRWEDRALSAMLTVMFFLLLIPTQNAWNLVATPEDPSA
ncbi:MAG: hypothetical protein WBA63_14325 [Thermomicrobiales bacterium]